MYNFTYGWFISGLQRGIKRKICWKRGECRVTGMLWWWWRCVSPLRDNRECLKGLCNWQSLWLSLKMFIKQFWNVFNRYFFCILCLTYNQVNLNSERHMLLKFLFICFWLHWVFTVTRELSLVVARARESCVSWLCAGASLVVEHRL